MPLPAVGYEAGDSASLCLFPHQRGLVTPPSEGYCGESLKCDIPACSVSVCHSAVTITSALSLLGRINHKVYSPARPFYPFPRLEGQAAPFSAAPGCTAGGSAVGGEGWVPRLPRTELSELSVGAQPGDPEGLHLGRACTHVVSAIWLSGNARRTLARG